MSHRMGSLSKGQKGRVVSLVDADPKKDPERAALLHRLRELGVLEGTDFEIVAEAPLGSDPIAIKMRNSVFALRRDEADNILVELVSGI